MNKILWQQYGLSEINGKRIIDVLSRFSEVQEAVLFSAMKMKSDDVYVAREPASFLCSITKMGYFLFLRNGDYFSHFLYICAIIYIKF